MRGHSICFYAELMKIIPESKKVKVSNSLIGAVMVRVPLYLGHS